MVSGCSLTPPSISPEAQRRQRAAQTELREAEATRGQLRAEHEALVAEETDYQRELEVLGAERSAAEAEHREQESAYANYEQLVSAAEEHAVDCSETASPFEWAERGVALARSLEDYAAEPRRDAALKALDDCRRALLEPSRKLIRAQLKDSQREFAETIEDNFDENNPYSRGDLKAKVSGTKLEVKMRGNFEGRARHSQDQADTWCVVGSGLFSKVTLRNSHGTFSCVPDDGPKQLSEAILASAGLSESWDGVGESSVPTPPDPLPPVSAALAEGREDLSAKLERVGGEQAEVEAALTELGQRESEASSTIAAVEREQAQLVLSWGDAELGKAKKAKAAGTTLLSLGGAVFLASLGLNFLGMIGGRGFAIGAGISAPLVLAGAGSLIGGGVHERRVRKRQAELESAD
ncbi:hypothetical protein G6O69_22330 [Pseudenhygromyxa sp. WMMC2535]|uniref:hypothetical protein n=1 Tax=Pseudenhygromyxa sp. WMMC2535 TaxID=2712867 RepID=UPI001557B928|nr:hypothetical protein [Pseudenhygromyxa sp. WMMC2535]NVB40594.1 hypothetical protein [Pseudenhygromyxa sp. WMMC2535]